MSLELWLAFVAASAVLLIIPGPTILTVISYSMTHGRRAKLPLVAAVAPGSRWKLFANTYLVTALNPKGIVFFVAFLPQFINPGAVHLRRALGPHAVGGAGAWGQADCTTDIALGVSAGGCKTR